MHCPAEFYTPSPRPYAGLPALDYPFHDKAVTVTTCGRICFNRQKINLSQVFAGQTVGIKQVDDRLWLATFMHYDLGYFDECAVDKAARRPVSGMWQMRHSASHTSPFCQRQQAPANSLPREKL